jgi:outer membrane lipoprotein-sorting protein
MSVSDFKAVAPEKIDGRDTKVIQYRFGEPGDNSEEPITLWIDAKTMLPLKRVISLKFENLHITEYYTDFKLDPKLDANAFDLVSAPANEAEKLFRAVEEKVKSAKAVQFTFDIEMKEKDKQAKSRGSLLFTNANQARLKMTVPEDAKEVTVEMISDGKRMKMAESPDTLAKADDAATPANLHSMLSSFVCGPGLLLTFDRLNPGPAPPMFRLVNFNTGPTEKLGGRDAKVVTYNVTLLGGTAEVTLWIDAEKMLPLKRVIVADGKGDTVRVTELCSVSLDPKVQADAFVLPK